jgi:hypothetical protein
MCSSGQVTLELIADELEGKWEPIEQEAGVEQAGDAEGEDDDDLADFMSDDDDDMPEGQEAEEEGSEAGSDYPPPVNAVRGRRYREPTPFIDQNDLLQDVARELRLAGRDFLIIDGQYIEIQHNSVRDFVLSEEEAIKPDEVACLECRKRLKEMYCYEAGPKEGNRKK